VNIRNFLCCSLVAGFASGCAFRPVDCASHRTGRFQEELLPGLWSVVLRSDSDQVEQIPAEGYEARYGLRWKNVCTYQLFDKVVVQGTSARTSAPGDTITVTMLGVDRKGFRYIASSNYADQVLDGRQDRHR